MIFDISNLQKPVFQLPLPEIEIPAARNSESIFRIVEVDAASWVSASFSTFAADSLGAKVGETVKQIVKPKSSFSHLFSIF